LALAIISNYGNVRITMEKTIETEEKKPKKEDPMIEEMTKAGLYFGHRTSKIHPGMMPYTKGIRNGVYIIDLEATSKMLSSALDFIKKIVSEKKILLLVGTKIQTKSMVEETAKKADLPFVSQRWLGGTFTNFESIKKRIDNYKDLEDKKKKGDFEKYTKKERIRLDEEIEALRIKFEGIKNLEKLPDAVFVCDMKKDELAVKEAKAKGIKVIAIADTNVNPAMADYPIPANDDAVSSVRYILEKMAEAVKK